MKEITREDWKKNPTPRMMWVWDDDAAYKEKRLVVHCLTSELAAFGFAAESETGTSIVSWLHCAEIEEPQQRRMTYKELSRWLRDHPKEHREWKYDVDTFVCIIWGYDEESAEEEVKGVLIRSNGGEWHEPLVEVEE